MEPKLRFIAILMGCAAMAMSIPACSKATADPPTVAATIRSEETTWLKAIAERRLDETVSYYANGALLLAPNAPIARTTDEIRQTWTAVFASIPASATLSAETTKVDVAPTGDLGYTTGTFLIAENHTTIDQGKFVDIWRKQSDGSWKAVIDIFNSDLPAPPSAK